MLGSISNQQSSDFASGGGGGIENMFESKISTFYSSFELRPNY